MYLKHWRTNRCIKFTLSSWMMIKVQLLNLIGKISSAVWGTLLKPVDRISGLETSGLTTIVGTCCYLIWRTNSIPLSKIRRVTYAMLGHSIANYPKWIQHPIVGGLFVLVRDLSWQKSHLWRFKWEMWLGWELDSTLGVICLNLKRYRVAFLKIFTWKCC
jgi:hypothetical protein